MPVLKKIIILLGLAAVAAGSIAAADETAWVINTSGESLSKINLTTGAVTNNVLPLGSDIYCYPNQIVVRDTLAFVVASGTNEIQIINLKTETTVDFIGTGAGSNPFWLAFADDRYCYVTSLLRNSVLKVDVIDRTLAGEIPVGVSPEGILIADGRAYVAVTGFDFGDYSYDQGRVAVLDIAGDSLLGDIEVGTNPQYLARDAAGRIHVVCTGNYFSAFGIVYVIDPALDVVVDSTVVGGAPGQIAITPDGMAYLAAGGWVDDGHLYSYNAMTGEVYHGEGNPIPVDSGCTMVVSYQDSTLYEGGFKDFAVQVDSAGVELARYAVGDGPAHMDFNYMAGDVDGSFSVNVADLTGLVDWLFRGGTPPRYPAWRANTDGDSRFNVSDITHLVAYLFNGGEAPRIGSNWLMP